MAAVPPDTADSPSWPWFLLTIRRTDRALRIQARGPAGHAHGTTPLPDDELTALRGADGPLHQDAARRIGALLYAALFPPAIDRLLEESRHRVGHQPLPIALDVRDEALATLPWELLFDPDTRRFLALSPGSPLSRTVASDVTSPPGAAAPGDLRVHLVATTIDEETLRWAQALAAEQRLAVSTSLPSKPPRRPAHVVVVRGPLDPATAVPGGTALAVLDGDLIDARQALRQARAVIALPGHLSDGDRKAFVRALCGRLAAGETVESAAVTARRAIADTRAEGTATWASPRLLTATPPAPLVIPEELRTMLGAKLRQHTAAWFRDALSGVVSSIAVFLVILILFRLGFSPEASFELDVVSPVSLYQSFGGLVIELSSYQEFLLLGTAVVLSLATVITATLWSRRRTADQLAASSASRLASLIASLRTVAFFAVATLTVLTAYGYQQYLWRVRLPVPAHTLGVAVTRADGAGELASQLSATLQPADRSRQIIVRRLPVSYDAQAIDRARDLGRRIGARAVVIYRADQHGDRTEHVAYLVFPTPPFAAITIRPPVLHVAGFAASARPDAVVRLREGVAVPSLRTATLAGLTAVIAGVIASEEGWTEEAIAHLERARSMDTAVASNGLADVYLGGAYALAGQDAAAIAAYERAVLIYERTAAVERLGPEDELTLVRVYLALARLASERGDVPTALRWLEKGVAHRDTLLARVAGLEHPGGLHQTYARLYALLAAIHRAAGDPEEAAFWARRADQEAHALATLVNPAAPTDHIALASVRLAIGDCVGAVAAANAALALAPGDPDALAIAAAIAHLQGQRELARSHLEQAMEVNPGARTLLGLSFVLQAVNWREGYFEPTHLEEAERVLAADVAGTPASLDAAQTLGEIAVWRAEGATQDLAALWSGDDLSAATSAVLRKQDPVRREAAVAAFSTAIARLHPLVERRPADPAAALALAGAYAGRMRVRFSALITTQHATTADQAVTGAQIVADAEDVRSLAASALAGGSGASRLDRLRAWALTLEAFNDAWTWQAVFAGESAAANAMLPDMRQAMDAALAYVEEIPPASDGEAEAMRAIYAEIARFETLVNGNQGKAANALAARAKMVSPTSGGVLLTSLCREEQERLAGDVLAAAGNDTAARTHYEAALAINATYAPALLGLSNVLFRLGDLPGATAQAAAATEAAPGLAAAWQTLGRLHLAAGDRVQRDAAYDRFLAIVATRPAAERIANLRTAVTGLQDLLGQQSAAAPAIVETLPAIRAALDGIGADDARAQLAGLTAELGHLALMADDRATAEELLRRALQLDSHRPLARVDLALAVLVQGRDATAEIAAAIAAVTDPLWEEAGVGRLDLLARMATEVDDYLQHHPDRAATVEPLRQALARAAPAPPIPATPVTIPSPSASTPVPATPVPETYLSPTYGFSLTMVGDWVIRDAASERGVDQVSLTNGRSYLFLTAAPADGMTPNECLQREFRSLSGDPQVSDVRPMTTVDGRAIRGHTAAGVFAAFRYTFAGQDGLAPDRVKYIECRSIPGHDALLVVAHFAAAAEYEAEAEARTALLAGLSLSVMTE